MEQWGVLSRGGPHSVYLRAVGGQGQVAWLAYGECVEEGRGGHHSRTAEGPWREMSASSIHERASELTLRSLWSGGQADLHPGSRPHSPGLAGCRRGVHSATEEEIFAQL